MPIADKLDLLKEVENGISDDLTAATLRTIMAKFSTILDSYEVERTSRGTPEHNDQRLPQGPEDG